MGRRRLGDTHTVYPAADDREIVTFSQKMRRCGAADF